MGYLNFALLFIISTFHFYWVLGGQFGRDAAFPNIENKPDIFPGKMMTIAAGAVFMGFAFIYLNQELGLYPLPNQTVIGILGVIFMLRAVGEFKYVGFSKRVYNSKFAELDTKLYSPLCVLLGSISFYIYYYG